MPAQPNCFAKTNPGKSDSLIGGVGHHSLSLMPPSMHLRSNEGSRPWKKCPPREKKNFLQHLMDFMTKAFVGNSRDSLNSLFRGKNADLTHEERVAKWQFILMDRNKNGVSCDFLSTYEKFPATMPPGII